MSQVSITRDGLAIDNRPFYLLAGQVHYFRWPRDEWRDILLKARAAGLNTIDTVIPWNLHEPAEGRFDFDDYADLPGYLDLIAELGLHAIVRPAPYICAEWENGGFPAWLTARLAAGENGLALRTLDPRFWEPTMRWWDRLIPLLVERQADRGGPIILAQIDNEHWASGVYGHDAYQQRQAEELRRRGMTVPLYTCMGAGRDWPEFRNGWSGIADKLVATRRIWPDNPMIVSELWSGWFDDWGKSRHNGKTAAALDWKLHELLAVGCAGFSHWVWAGGTNFAHWGGRTVGGDTVHMTTSYDYDAPISEYGRPTAKFYAARRHHLLLGTLGAQLSRLLADAHEPGPSVVAPKAVPGRASGGSEPWRNVRRGPFTATFLQNPTLERQTHQLFLPATDASPAAHLVVDVEAGTIKPIFSHLPLGDQGLTLRLHTSRLLGYWPSAAGDTLVFYGFEGEVGRVELLAAGRWQVLDAAGCRVDADDGRLALRYWIGRQPIGVRAAVDDRPVMVVLTTQALAERWWPLGDGHFLCGPDLVTDPTDEAVSTGQRVFRLNADGRLGATAPSPGRAISVSPIRLGLWESLDLAERLAESGWQPLNRLRPMEELGCPLGYGWYRGQFTLSEGVETTLAAPWLSDRATLFVDGVAAGVVGVDPAGARLTLPLALSAGRHDLRLLVDNLGRFNYGSNTGERKGLLDTLYWGGVQEDISGGWAALWQEAVFAGEALANAKPAHVRPDAEDVHLGHFAWSGSSVWLLREVQAPAGRRLVVTLTGDRNPGALFVNGQAVTRFSRHYGGGYIKEDITAHLRPGVNVLALHIEDYGGLPWAASLLHFDHRQVLGATWSFRGGVTPGRFVDLETPPPPSAPGSHRAPVFWRSRFAYDPGIHGQGPFCLSMHGLSKGQIWLNGRNVGRYWQVGPQEFYKLPASWLQVDNELLILDESGASPEGVRVVSEGATG